MGKKKKTNLILPPAHLPPLVLLPLPHVLEEEAAPALLGVLAPLEHGVGTRVAGGEAEFAVLSSGGGVFIEGGLRGRWP
jgi:hypothetical protein